MITSSIWSNHLRVKQIESIQVNRVAQIPSQAIWVWCQWKMVNGSLDCTYRDDISGSDSEMRLMMVASIMERLHWRLMSLLDNHHTSSQTYRLCYKPHNQGEKLFDSSFTILDDEQTLQPCGNASCCRVTVAIRTCPHPEKYCIIPWWLMLSPPFGPSATNHMNCLLVALTRCHRSCYCIEPTVFCIIELTEILIVINIVGEVGMSL